MPAITMYSKETCPYCDSAKRLLASKGQAWTEIDIEAEPARRDEMIERSGRRTVPQIWIGDRHVGGFDDLAALDRSGELDELLGLRAAAASPAEHVRLLIIGSGPAGWTAALYAGRAELKPVVIAGLMAGGQLMLTTDVENYPGFPDGISGTEMMERFQAQAVRFGTRVFQEDATRIDLSRRPFRVETSERAFTADAVILAMGASAKWLNIPSEQRLMNRGVSACATCDGALYKGKEMAVVGGGDTAMEEALYLTRFASKVHLLHRRAEFRASRIMEARAERHPQIQLHRNTVIEEVLGDTSVTGLRLRDSRTDARTVMPVDGLFVAIGYRPNTGPFEGWLERDEAGYLAVHSETHSRIDGVFIAGDVHDHRYRQAVTAAGDGCRAAIDAERWLEEHQATEPAVSTAG
jgi:thioredoxin reductase (NADPH)